MRLTILAVAIVHLAGCACGKPIAEFCKVNACDDVSTQEARVLKSAERRWVSGSCDGLSAGTCRGGGRWILEGGSFCATVSYFDKKGSIAFAETGCEGETLRYGFMFGCERVSTRDFCAEARTRVTFKHLRMLFDAPLPVSVDGVPVEVRLGRNEATLAPGLHAISLDGRALEVEVIEKPVTLATELRLVTWDPAMQLSADRRPVGRSSVRDCIAQGCGYDVGLPGQDAGVLLTFRSTFGQIDGGPPAKKFGEDSAY
jgi:hypothetical protein